MMDKRFALRSIFIRSMLGGSSAAQRGKTTTAQAQAAKSNTARAKAEAASSKNTMSVHATPLPPIGAPEPATNAASADPEGYVNPFAAGNDAQDGKDVDQDTRAFSFENGFAEAQSNVVRLPNIRGAILEKVVEYLCWSAKYAHAKDGDIPGFEHRIPPEIALEV